ncbi:MAG TPA: hypothetical protein VKI41_01895 [Vicinamibacteria bacterium]|nr:hypothetical protein [Vicinamibacteria bacterium]
MGYPSPVPRFPRAALPWALIFALARPAAADSPLSRLATALADEIARTAQGRPVEIGSIEDRTGRGAAFVLDLRNLLLSRLEGRLSAGSSSRLRVEPVLMEAPLRLVVSARVVSEPEGSLVDVISVSVPTDPAVLPLSPARPPAGRSGFETVSSSRTPPLEGPVVGLALLSDDRVLVLQAEALGLYRLEDSRLVRLAQRPLPGPLEPVRLPGGLLLATEGGLVWAVTSRSPRASLFAVEEGGRRLGERLVADALPWPGSPGGLRFRPGTNLLEGSLEGLGPGPFLAVTDAAAGVAVDPDGRLRVSAPDGPRSSGLRSGTGLASLWKGILAAASASPPGATDAILILERGEREWILADSLPVPGAVRALAASVHGDTARLVAALEDPGGETYLLLLDLRRTTS